MHPQHNIAGICGISVPCGFTQINDKQLPVGLHLQCQAYDEGTMFRTARMFERASKLVLGSSLTPPKP